MTANENRIRCLRAIPVGHTRSVNAVAVTRWSVERYEVGTWARHSVDVQQAVDAIWPPEQQAFPGGDFAQLLRRVPESAPFTMTYSDGRPVL